MEEPVDSAENLPTCSVVIPTRDRPTELEQCLRSLTVQTRPAMEIIVVDSAPQRVPALELAKQFGARYLLAQRKGLSLARNLGAREAYGEIIVFVDDDAVPAPDCVANLVPEFTDERVMAVSGRTLVPHDQDAATLAFESYGGFDPGPERRVVDSGTPNWFELVNFGGLGIGAIMAFRRSVFGTWPGFDQRLGRGAPQDCSEELHAWFSLADCGWKVVYCPTAVVMHPGPPSLAELRRRLIRDAAWASAYTTLLFMEYPRHRRRILRYVSEAIGGESREWRQKPTDARHLIVPRWRERLAWVVGPFLYLRMRLQVLFNRTRPGIALKTPNDGQST